MADELRFLCDEMLAGLGRWLRIAGYDTAIASGGRRDRDLVKQAHAEQRILLTRDRRVVEIRPATGRSSSKTTASTPAQRNSDSDSSAQPLHTVQCSAGTGRSPTP